MNERMTQMAERCGLYGVKDYDNTSSEDVSQSRLDKFAELIVREQLGIWERMDNGNKVEGYIEMEDYPKAIIKHFGIGK